MKGVVLRIGIVASLLLAMFAVAISPIEARYDLKIVDTNRYWLDERNSGDWYSGGTGFEPYLLSYSQNLLTYGSSRNLVWYGSIAATKVGDGQCVAFVKALSNTNNIASTNWKTGRRVMDNGDVTQGTVVATFASQDNYRDHVAVFDKWHWVYLGNNQWKVDGFYVWDANYVVPLLAGRHILKQSGTGPNNADNYYVVQLN